jgi:hypothetical protein
MTCKCYIILYKDLSILRFLYLQGVVGPVPLGYRINKTLMKSVFEDNVRYTGIYSLVGKIYLS